jgi:outer membrane protein W
VIRALAIVVALGAIAGDVRADSAPDASVGVAVTPIAPQPSLLKPERRHRLYLRVGVAFVKPLATSNELQLADVDGPASLAVMDGPIAGSGASVSGATIPALIVGVVLPWLHDRLSLETVLGTPFTVKFRATGTLANQSIAPTALGIPTGVPALGPELGEATAAPPVLTAVYQLVDHGRWRPYAGLGFAMLIATDAKMTNPILTAVSQPKFTVDPAPGLALQAGLDVRLSKLFYARLDVKFIALMDAHATAEHIQVATPNIPAFGTVEVGTAKMDVMVNPLIVQAAIGFDFW